MPVSLVILAAGQGTRMMSDIPKVLHAVAGAPLLHHAMASGAILEPKRHVVVAGHGADQVAASAQAYAEDVAVVIQAERLGTGHAVAQAKEALEDVDGDVIVLYADTPFVSAQTLEAMVEARARHDVIVLGFEAADPARYGRLVMDGDALQKIVEFKDATPEERAITLCNSGVICASRELMFQLIDALDNTNAAGEYYLTDLPGLARARGLSAGVVICPEGETLGVNSRSDLALAEAAFQAKARAEALANGVTLVAPDTVFFAFDTVIGRDAVVEPNVVFAPGVTVETGATIRAFSHLEGCHVARGAVVGPYARLRPGAELSENSKVGNFVEVKNAVVAEGAKINHLSYVGDASVGPGANIGAGTITCNYDGVFKHRTEIGARAFVGSNSTLVAPLKIGDEAMTAAGSTITRDVAAESMALGRANQIEKPGLAKRLFDKLKAAKAKGQS